MPLSAGTPDGSGFGPLVRSAVSKKEIARASRGVLSGREPFASPFAAALENETAPFGTHSFPKPVIAFALNIPWLKSPFHDVLNSEMMMTYRANSVVLRRSGVDSV